MDFTAFRANLSGMIKGHGLSIRGLALEVGITPATLSRYLNGTRTPDLPYIAKLAHYFNVSIDWMLGICGDKFDVFPQELQNIIFLYQRASVEDRLAIKILLDKYSKPDEG